MVNVFHGINLFFSLVSWVYQFRVVLWFQALVCFWRGCLYFENSLFWNEMKNIHKTEIYGVVIPALWTGSSLYWIWIIVITLVSAICREEMIRWFTGTTRAIGINFYYLGKAVGEMGVLQSIIFIGDHVADPKIADKNLAACFICAYLHLATVLKLVHIGKDLGLADGLLSVALSIYSHLARTNCMRVLGVFICVGFVFLKNLACTQCCARCERSTSAGDNTEASQRQSADQRNQADAREGRDIESDAESFYSVVNY